MPDCEFVQCSVSLWAANTEIGAAGDTKRRAFYPIYFFHEGDFSIRGLVKLELLFDTSAWQNRTLVVCC